MDDDQTTGRRVASDLLRIGAVSLNPSVPFTWASGLRSPIYCDNRLTMAYPAVRDAICEGFVGMLDREGIKPEVVVGTATAGIPHAAWLADRLGLPLAYVRARPKEHGRKNRIEGIVSPGQRAVIVEDLISTGGSSLEAAIAVQETGAHVEAVIAVFSYQLEEAGVSFKEAGVPWFPLVTFELLLDAARDSERLSNADMQTLRAWKTDPKGWSERFLNQSTFP